MTAFIACLVYMCMQLHVHNCNYYLHAQLCIIIYKCVYMRSKTTFLNYLAVDLQSVDVDVVAVTVAACACVLGCLSNVYADSTTEILAAVYCQQMLKEIWAYQSQIIENRIGCSYIRTTVCLLFIMTWMYWLLSPALVKFGYNFESRPFHHNDKKNSVYLSN